MLSAIKTFFEEHVLTVEKNKDPQHGVKLAAAALLIEMMRMDDDLHEDERIVMLNVLRKKFSLSDAETKELLELASMELKSSTDYYQFTSLINQHFDYPERVHLIELLWQVAYADKSLAKEEEFLVRKISELIYVSHEDFIIAKLKVRDKNL